MRGQRPAAVAFRESTAIAVGQNLLAYPVAEWQARRAGMAFQSARVWAYTRNVITWSSRGVESLSLGIGSRAVKRGVKGGASTIVSLLCHCGAM